MAETVTNSVISKLVDSLFGVAKKEISYMWNYSKNVEEFSNVLEALKVMKDAVQQQIDIANSKGDNLVHGVQDWMNMVEVEISKAEEFLEQEANAKKTCFDLCVNLITLYRYGKEAIEKTPSLKQHLERGTGYQSCVTVYTPAPGPLDVYEEKNLDEIVTQNSALGEIIKAIEDESIQIIGIHGLGGVGKTTLAKEVAARVKHLFAEVAFTTVSQNPNTEKIKKDTENARKRITKEEKVLIILDDVWEKPDLEELCIPCNKKNFKILLTSRREDVCNKMNAHKIWVKSLPKEEAWVLFKRVVGEKVETDVSLTEVARMVVEECGGLPLLIKAVGNALKDRSSDEWKSALDQLKKRAPASVDEDIEKAYNSLKLSYDYLKSEEAKSCFLLCSMFPEDSRIELKYLVYYGVGLGKFDGLESMEDARQRVQNAVIMLTSCGLLLKEKDERATKMHDVVRDVALLIASQGENKFLVQAGKGLTEWQPRKKELESYTGISLMGNFINKLPDYEIHLPLLDTLLLQKKKSPSLYPTSNKEFIAEEFFRGMKKVRVLDMACVGIPSLPRSLKLLTKLRMLNLDENKDLCDISILGELKDLEILILSSTGITEIPQEIGRLVNLRLLEVKDCRNLSHIAPNVILNLHWLEELLIDFYHVHEGIKNNIVEVMNLSSLTYLELRVPCIDVIPQVFNSGKLKGFEIQVCEEVYQMSNLSTLDFISKRHLHLGISYLQIPLLEWIKNFIEAGITIGLGGTENLNNILPTLYDEGFNKLEHIWLKECPNVSCLVDTREWNQLENFHSSRNHQLISKEGKKAKEKFLIKLKTLYLLDLDSLEVLWNCPDEYISFSNLVTLVIVDCNKLERVFSVRVARNLGNLKVLNISNCYGLKEVIYGGDDRDEIIEFPHLVEVNFYNLSRLKSFCSGNSTIIYPSLTNLSIEDCVRINNWGPGIHKTPTLELLKNPMVNIPVDGPEGINDAVAKYYEGIIKMEKLQDRMHYNLQVCYLRANPTGIRGKMALIDGFASESD